MWPAESFLAANAQQSSNSNDMILNIIPWIDFRNANNPDYSDPRKYIGYISENVEVKYHKIYAKFKLAIAFIQCTCTRETIYAGLF